MSESTTLPRQSRMQDAYSNGTYLHQNPSWHQEDSPWKAGHVMKILRDNRIKPATVCEIGCGASGILQCLCQDLPDNVVLHGYEMSPQAFELCRAKKNGRLFFHQDDVLTESMFFDVMLCVDVLEHVEDYFEFLRRLRQKAEYKVFHIPLEITLRRVLSGARFLRTRHSFGHIQYFTREIALATLKDTGYEVIDHYYTAPSLELPHRSFKERLLALPRKCLFALNKDLAARILGGYSLLVLTR